MMSAFILTIVLLAVAMTLATGVASMYFSQEQLIAKQKAREALESVFTARSTQNVLFDDIENTGDGGIFLDGFQPVRGMGTDGIANTADDSSQPIETTTFPGADGQLGTGDDEARALTGFERRISVGDVLLPNNNADPDIRQITVSVRFRIRNVWHTVTVSSYISRFA